HAVELASPNVPVRKPPSCRRTEDAYQQAPPPAGVHRLGTRATLNAVEILLIRPDLGAHVDLNEGRCLRAHERVLLAKLPYPTTRPRPRARTSNDPHRTHGYPW